MFDNESFKKISDLVSDYCAKNHKFTFDQKNPIVRLHEPTFGADEINSALIPLLTTKVTMGEEVKKFERQYASEFGHKYGVMNNSGSSANLLAIAAIANKKTENNLQSGDEVLVPALSWSTTVWPLIQLGLVPVFVDCDPLTYNLDLNKLEAAISPKTKAIMLVHVYGNPCDMDGIMDIAKRRNLQVIEDSCESMGAYYKNKAVGSFGRVGTFSFYYSHHITTLEGGICVTDDYELAETIKILRAHGWSRESEHHQKYVAQYPEIDPRFIFVNIGYNLRPTELQAMMGQVQLPKLADFVKKRREAQADFNKSLSKFSEFFDFQREQKDGYSSWFGFCITLKKHCPFSVKEITSFLQANKIETRPVIAGNIAVHPVMQDYEYRASGDLANANYIMKNSFAIGCHHNVCQDARDYVISIFHKFFAEKNINS